ncbi:response regulator [Shigella flexneri]
MDDEDNVGRMLTPLLHYKDSKHIVRTTDARRSHLFADIHPDVVLMDIRMPEMDGVKALKEMRGHETRTPVILMTAYAEVENRRRSATLRSLRLCSKPFDLDELNLIVQRAYNAVNEKEMRHLHGR